MLQIFFKAVKLTAADFFQNTSLSGFKLLFFLGKSKILQTVWIPFLLTGLIAGAYITGHCILYFQLNPTVTYIHTLRYPVSRVPFPGVSICSVNKISKQAMQQYAQNVSKLGKDLDEKILLEKFALFGGLFDPIGFDVDASYELQTFLDKIHGIKSGFYDVRELLKTLAPKCDELLHKCSWAGRTIPCSELFTPQISPEGVCCIFNYNRKGFQTDKSSVKRLGLNGQDNGLKVLLNTSTNDYFYSQRSTTGFIVQIFNSLFYPDILTGELSEFPVIPRTDVLVPLVVISLSSEEHIKDYKLGQRGCYFDDELPKEYGKQYSQQECLLKCKLRKMQSICNCIPFYTPEDFLDPPVKYCTLAHLECLSRYKMTWTFYRPTLEMDDALQEMEYSLACDECLPLCSTNEYEYQIEKSDFDLQNSHNNYFLQNESHLDDASLLRIFYGTPYCAKYKKQLIYSSDGLLANVGGILGISIGCSLVSIIEIAYFATIRFYKNFKILKQMSSATHKNDWKPTK